MISEAEVAGLSQMVVWGSFAICLLLGVVMSRTDFCTMGAVSDIVNLQDWTRMRMWLAAIAVAIVGTQVLAGAGLIDTRQSIYTSPRLMWLSNILGGLMFGFGMVLASGCGTKTLLRLGAGNLKSLVVFMVMGVFAYMTLKGVFAVWRVGLIDPIALDFQTGQDLPRLLAGQDLARIQPLQIGLGLVIGGGLLAWTLTAQSMRQARPLIGAVAVGLGIVAVWFLSSHLGFVAEDPSTLEARYLGTQSGRPESLSFVAPAAYTLELLMLWSDQSKTLTLGIAAVIGIAAGATLNAVVSGTFRWEGFRGAEDTANHLIGAALMGIGGVMALGCTIGQGISGLSTLSVGSLIAMLAIVCGALAGLRYQIWRVDRMV
jgi:uncharacterized membrane protein YedE/YeeE